MATVNPTEGLRGRGTIMKKGAGWFTAMAVVFIILGFMAILEPGIAGLAATILVGWLLIFAGGAHLVAAFSGGGAGRVIWQVILGIIYVIGGFYFLMHPLLGLGTLTLFLAGIIVAEAVLEFIAYFQTRGASGSGWLLGERVDHAAAGRADLDALAVKFGLGNRDAVRREPADDRNIATNAGDGGAKAGKPSGGQ